jgi:hypothetical protein
MDAAKFLRALADLIAAAQDMPEKSEEMVKSDETDVMIPPLQQEIELMKKATNVESEFDKTENIEEPNNENDNTVNEIGDSDNENKNELNILKKNAGLGLGLADVFKG